MMMMMVAKLKVSPLADLVMMVDSLMVDTPNGLLRVIRVKLAFQTPTGIIRVNLISQTPLLNYNKIH